MHPFHLAFPVRDLALTRTFFVEVLGCRVGRASERWIDFDFHGHQLSAHLRPEEVSRAHTNAVDGDDVPVRHFGLVLPWKEFENLALRLREASMNFLIDPHIRFAGEVGEQATMFLTDPSGNAIEFKSFKNPERLFAP